MKRSNLKRFISISLTTVAAFLFFSCASTEKTSAPAASQNNPQEELNIRIPTPLEIYQEKTAGISLKIESSPKETTKNKAFSSEYKIKAVKDDGTPVQSFKITVSYPSSKTNGKLDFSSAEILTDETGTASFIPEIPSFSCLSSVKFYPSKESDDDEVVKAAEALSVSAPFLVQTDKKNAGGLIAIVDFNQKGAPIRTNQMTSSSLLMTLMQLKFTGFGNIDLTDDILKGDDARIVRRAKELTGNASSTIIYGTVKYGETTKTDAGTTITLVAEIKSSNLKTGMLTVDEKIVVSATNANDWTALTNARKILTEKIAQSIKYGI